VGVLQIWDRRCFAQRNKPAGQLVGHLEGITFIDSRGDGRYFISNGKDQTLKLWDIRKMTSGSPSIRFSLGPGLCPVGIKSQWIARVKNFMSQICTIWMLQLFAQ
jgi:WD40 repeat protein